MKIFIKLEDAPKIVRKISYRRAKNMLKESIFITLLIKILSAYVATYKKILTCFHCLLLRSGALASCVGSEKYLISN